MLFIVLFVPMSIINFIYDILVIVVRGDEHEMGCILNWLSKKLLEKIS